MVIFNSEVEGLRNFPKGFSPKVNAIAREEIELAQYHVIDEHVNSWATVTPV